MHRFIHPSDTKNRPEHDHTYTLTSDIHNHNTRHSHQQHHYTPHPPNPRSAAQPIRTIEHFTALYTAVWDKLPLKLRTTANYHFFKQDLKAYLEDKQATEKAPFAPAAETAPLAPAAANRALTCKRRL